MSLSSTDRNRVVDVCHAFLEADGLFALERCLAHQAKSILGYESVVGGLGLCDPEGISPRLMVNHRFSKEYLAEVGMGGGRMRPRLFQKWSTSPGPLSVDFEQSGEETVNEAARAAARKHGFRNMICHGQYSPDEAHLTYIAFMSFPGKIEARTETMVALIVPHIHAAMLRISRDRAFEPCSSDYEAADPSKPTDVSSCVGSLSLRKRQILYLLSLGKTNWEISQVLSTSVDNVK